MKLFVRFKRNLAWGVIGGYFTFFAFALPFALGGFDGVSIFAFFFAVVTVVWGSIRLVRWAVRVIQNEVKP